MINLFKLFSDALCSHPVSALQFKGMIKVGDPTLDKEFMRYKYICSRCGTEIWSETPKYCGGCKHLYSDNSGGIYCDREPYDRACWKNGYVLYELEEGISQ